MPGGTAVWFTNTRYPPAVRAALEGMGYNFHSQNPAEDFLSKMVEVRVEIRRQDQKVAEFKFDPKRNFRLVRVDEFFGQRRPPAVPFVDPEDVGRLPLFGFPVLAGPLPSPGDYTVDVFWTLSDLHNDGLGLDPANDFLPAGEFHNTRVTTHFTFLP
jgi:hypothetical protein